MKVIVSSKNFYARFKGLRDQTIRSVRIDDNKMLIVRSDDEEIRMPVETREKNELALQHNIRWDWLLHDIGSINEQPVTIEFDNHIARFTLSY